MFGLVGRSCRWAGRCGIGAAVMVVAAGSGTGGRPVAGPPGRGVCRVRAGGFACYAGDGT